MKEIFKITGMTCSACSSHIEKSIKKLKGVKNVSVNLLLNKMEVEFNEKLLTSYDIIADVKKSGYGATLQDKNKNINTDEQSSEKIKESQMKKRFFWSLIFMIPLMIIAMYHMISPIMPQFLNDFYNNIFGGSENAISFILIQFLLTLPVLIINKDYFSKGFKNIIKLSPNMDSLIAIGSSAAVIYGIYALFAVGYFLGRGQSQNAIHYLHNLYFESAAMILTLITLGKYLEEKSKGKTSEAVKKLIDLAPKTATIIENGQELTVPADTLKNGDIIIVKQGESIPADGVIIEGYGEIDQSSLTGESLPVSKKEGDKVSAATINKAGWFKFKATATGKQTGFSGVIKLVEEALISKAPIAKLADKISGIFSYIVIAIAIITLITWILIGKDFEFALNLAISVLVISCPCALGLATPVAIMVSTGVGANLGILIKSASVLETAHKVSTVLMDKTGTITHGTPRITNVFINDENLNKDDFLRLCASAEQYSEHPLASAIISWSKNNKISLMDGKNFKSYEGKGISCQINEKTIYGGNFQFINSFCYIEKQIEDKAEKISQKGKTVLFFCFDNKFVGFIGLADVIRKSSIFAVESFNKKQIKTAMITGDNESTAKEIANKAKIRDVFAQCKPEEKEKIVSQYQARGDVVAFIGDGINDAPALARADVGIAIGAGVDVAIESADIVLVKNNLTDGYNAINLSKATMKNIKQNLFWAFFYNIIGIPIAAGLLYPFGILLNPMFGAAAMSLSSICVVANALRLKSFKGIKQAFENDLRDGVQTENDITMESIETIKTKGKNKIMEKIIVIDGMSCAHCSKRIEDALNSIDDVTASVNLSEKTALIKTNKNIDDLLLKKAIEQAGYVVVTIKNN